MASIPVGESKFHRQLSIIQQLLEANSIFINITKLVERKCIKISLNGITSLPRDGTAKERLRWIRVPHLGKFSWGLNKILKQGGFKPAYYNLNFMKLNLCKGLKGSVPRDERSGVYVLKCSECPAIYVGKTRRQLKIRLSEYIDDTTSAFGEHLTTSGHNANSISSKLLHFESNHKKRLAREIKRIF